MVGADDLPPVEREHVSATGLGRSALVAAGCLATAAVLYVVAVRLGEGQRLDDLGFEARKSLELGPRRAFTWTMRAATMLLLVAGPVIVGWLSWRRRAVVAGLAVLGSVAAVAVAARLLKGLLTRPDLLEFSWAGGANSFPSGHSSVVVAMSLGLVGLVDSAERGRWTAAMAVVVGLHTMGMVCSGWHRPSDVLAGLLIGAAAASLVVPLVVRAEGPVETAPAWYRRPTLVARALGAVAAVVVLVLLTLRHTPAVPGRSFLVFVLMAPTFGTAAAVLVIAHARRCDAAASAWPQDDVAAITSAGPGPGAGGTSRRPPR